MIQNGGFLKWGCPQIIYSNGVFQYKPSIFGISPFIQTSRKVHHLAHPFWCCDPLNLSPVSRQTKPGTPKTQAWDTRITYLNIVFCCILGHPIQKKMDYNYQLHTQPIIKYPICCTSLYWFHSPCPKVSKLDFGSNTTRQLGSSHIPDLFMNSNQQYPIYPGTHLGVSIVMGVPQ